MTRPAESTPPPRVQPFRRPMAVAGLRRDVDTAFRVSAEPAEREALAEFLDVDAVERLSFAGFVCPHGKSGWRVRGRMVARVVQTCVVTLEPVQSRIEEDLERVYLPAREIPKLREVVLLPGDEDEPDSFTDSIDPAQLAVESLLLLIDPYPRSPGAELDPAAAGPDSPGGEAEERVKPFSGLAALMRRDGTEDE